MENKIEKIITHGGRFHADEVLAIAFLREKGITAPIHRSHAPISQQDYDNPNVLILDVGMQYDPLKGNFDHHQDKTRKLASTNVLILNEFETDKGKIENFRKHFFDYVSDQDRDLLKPIQGVPTLNFIISSLNEFGEKGFLMGVDQCRTLIKAQELKYAKSLTTENEWNTRYLKEGFIAYTKDKSTKMASWRELAYRDNVHAIIFPNERDGMWAVATRNNEEYKILPNEKQTFLHAAGFIAVYGDLETAIKVTNEQVLNHLRHQQLIVLRAEQRTDGFILETTSLNGFKTTELFHSQKHIENKFKGIERDSRGITEEIKSYVEVKLEKEIQLELKKIVTKKELGAYSTQKFKQGDFKSAATFHISKDYLATVISKLVKKRATELVKKLPQTNVVVNEVRKKIKI